MNSFLQPRVSPNSSVEIGLAKLSFILLTLSGNFPRDKTNVFNVSLKTCELEDMRPRSETKITRFMEKSTNVTDNMIDVTYTKNGPDSKSKFKKQ